MFDTFRGLPLHVLVLHLVVVLVPLTSAGTAAVFLRPKWRAKFGGFATAATVAMLALTFITVRAGIAFKNRLDPSGEGGIPQYDHQRYGTILLWIVLALAVVSLITWRASLMDNLSPAALTGLVAVVVLLAVGATVMTAVTGETGAKRWSYVFDDS